MIERIINTLSGIIARRKLASYSYNTMHITTYFILHVVQSKFLPNKRFYRAIGNSALNRIQKVPSNGRTLCTGGIFREQSPSRGWRREGCSFRRQKFLASSELSASSEVPYGLSTSLPTSKPYWFWSKSLDMFSRLSDRQFWPKASAKKTRLSFSKIFLLVM